MSVISMVIERNSSYPKMYLLHFFLIVITIVSKKLLVFLLTLDELNMLQKNIYKMSNENDADDNFRVIQFIHILMQFLSFSVGIYSSSSLSFLGERTSIN